MQALYQSYPSCTEQLVQLHYIQSRLYLFTDDLFQPNVYTMMFLFHRSLLCVEYDYKVRLSINHLPVLISANHQTAIT